MKLKNQIFIKILFIGLFVFISSEMIADEYVLAKLRVQEYNGIPRSLEYIEFELQLKLSDSVEELNLLAEDMQNGEQIPCQIFNKQIFKKDKLALIKVLFPISIKGNENKTFLIKRINAAQLVNSDLKFTGEALNIIVDNKYYSANLSKSNQSEAKNHDAGQLTDLLIKMDSNQLFFRTENRMHWAPSFQKQGVENYNTSSGWDKPTHYIFDEGPYLISTQRKDLAPDHPEILLTANYYFYAGLPYFKFFSSMNMLENVTIILLRNDEMTMDSLFTHVAYQNNSGSIIDLAFSERYSEFDKNPIDNNSPWLCFYHESKGYAVGSIRLKYDNTNENGLTSPTYLPHTKISNGAEGGKYWNRILIDNTPIMVPKGSEYIEENAYIVFKIDKKDKFKNIKEWMTILRNPLKISVFLENI